MSYYVLASTFMESFPNPLIKEFSQLIPQNSKFVFICSEFKKTLQEMIFIIHLYWIYLGKLNLNLKVLG